MPRKKNNLFISIIKLFFTLIFLGLSAGAVIYRQHIIDQITVWQYSPTSEVASLAGRSGMNDKGRFLFYASQPKISDASEFNSACVSVESTTSILGCYVDYDIYVYNISNVKLDGIREVTAAHEMLHAVYARMSDAEKISVNKLLDVEYQKVKNDQDFADLMEYYKENESDQLYNELHSIIGTTISDLSDELENYYEKYFSSRQSVVDLYAKYSGVFKDLSERAEYLVTTLNDLNADITSRSESFNQKMETLNADIDNFKDRAGNGYFTDLQSLYSEQNSLEYRISVLETEKANILADIEKYNSYQQELEQAQIESENLNKSINSTLVSSDSI